MPPTFYVISPVSKLPTHSI